MVCTTRTNEQSRSDFFAATVCLSYRASANRRTRPTHNRRDRWNCFPAPKSQERCFGKSYSLFV